MKSIFFIFKGLLLKQIKQFVLEGESPLKLLYEVQARMMLKIFYFMHILSTVLLKVFTSIFIKMQADVINDAAIFIRQFLVSYEVNLIF